MKSKHLIFGILCLLIIVSTITNPKKEDHLNFVFNNFLNKEKLENANVFELFTLNILKKSFEEILYVDNYVIFSIGKINHDGIEKKVSIGFLGNVFPLIKKSEFQKNDSNLKPKEENSNGVNKSNLNANHPRVETKSKVGDKIYGDFNGDGKFEYAFRVLTKKGYGNPAEDGTNDAYEIQFSDKNIKPIKNDFCWFILINEGDLDIDGADEISVREECFNGCTGSVSTYTIKSNKPYILIEPFSFYKGACDNDTSINPDDLVENDNGIVYYYEYNVDGVFEPNGGYCLNSNGEKIFGKKIKAF